MNINILLRGQSNSVYLWQDGVMQAVQTQVQKLLGFDGTTNTVTLLGGTNISSYSGTQLLPGINEGHPSWLVQNAAGQWVANTSGPAGSQYENQLLSYLSTQATKGDPTATIWVQNETDSVSDTASTLSQWTTAVTAEAGMERAALGGQSAATTPYLFWSVPYDFGTGAGAMATTPSMAAGALAIREGQEALVNTPGFNAGYAAHNIDMNMDETLFDGGGYQHVDPTDASQLITSMAESVAQSMIQYAQPGSPILSGTVDVTGPEVVGADLMFARPTQVRLDIALGTDTTGLQTLSGTAATGIQWSATDYATGQTIQAVSAQIVDGHDLLLTFNQALTATDVVFYGTGSARVGEGNGIYDNQGMSLWMQASGMALGNPTLQPASGGAVTQTVSLTSAPQSLAAGSANMVVYGGAGTMTFDGGTGTSTVMAGNGSATVSGDAGRITVYGGAGSNMIYGGAEGGNMLLAGSGTSVLVGTHDDWFSGSSGNATIYVGGGENTVFQGTGNVQTSLSTGNDLIIAGTGTGTTNLGTGSDTVWGTAATQATNVVVGAKAGTATVFGGVGTDQVWGNGGTLTAYAGSGHMTVEAGESPATIFGGTGLTAVFGGSSGEGPTEVVANSGTMNFQGGSDLANIFAGSGLFQGTGGSGATNLFVGTGSSVFFEGTGPTMADFVHGQAGGSLNLTGFVHGRDVIALQGYGGSAIQQALSSAHAVAGGIGFGLSDGSQAVIHGVSSLSASDFISS